MQKIFFECSETYRIKNKHPTEQMDSFMGGLIGKVVQSGKSRLQDKTGKLRYIWDKKKQTRITIPHSTNSEGSGYKLSPQ